MDYDQEPMMATRESKPLLVDRCFDSLAAAVGRLEKLVDDINGIQKDLPEKKNPISNPTRAIALKPLLDGLPERAHSICDRIDKTIQSIREAVL